MSIRQARRLDYNTSDVSGSGIIDDAKALFSRAVNAYSGETGTMLRNMLPDADELARPGFAGEKHALLFNKNGVPVVGNYIGPGTRVLERLKRGDPPRTAVDRAAQAHDLRYMLATDKSQVRDADNRMISALERLRATKGDDRRNILMAETLMKGKRLAEDVGLMSPSQFASMQGIKQAGLSKEDKKMIGSTLGRLQAEGYGNKPAGRGITLEDSYTATAGANQSPVMSGLVREGKGTRPAGGGTHPAGGAMEEGKAEEREYPGDTLRRIAAKAVKGSVVGKAKDVANAAAMLGDEIFKKIRKESPVKTATRKLLNSYQGFGKTRDMLYSHLKPKKQMKKKGGAFDWMSLIKSAAKRVAPTVAGWLGLNKGEIDMIKGKLMPLIDDIIQAVGQKVGSGAGRMRGMRLAARDIAGGSFWDDFADGFRYGFNATADLASNIPGDVGAIAKKMPNLGGPKSIAELKANKRARDKAEANARQADLDTAAQKGQALTSEQKAQLQSYVERLRKGNVF